jgi:pimeloyl-ACP methyl ester carboxylesterase
MLDVATPEASTARALQPSSIAAGRGFSTVPNPLADRPIWITGHSLGGAAAILTAYRLKTAYDLPVRGVYTIGQPTCANQAFANGHFAEGLQLHRVVHATDFVARSFAELPDLPLEHTEIQLAVANGLTAGWPSPTHVALRALVYTAFTPKWLANFGLSIYGQALQATGGMTHFSTLRYFDHNGGVVPPQPCHSPLSM